MGGSGNRDKTRAEGNTEPAGKPSSSQQASTRKQKVQKLGDFELVRKLGQGGMGAVYLAHQVSLDRKCALKVMSSQLSQKKDFVERFIREARVGAKIEHPNVVRCYAVGEHKGIYFAALEFIDGPSMQDWIKKLGTLEVGDAVHITIVCAQALGHAHKMNLIHRDIKPDNILVTKTGMVKVADLGLAKAVDDDQSMTQSGTGMGTPLYMPPEQARNAKYVDQRSDIYALGCTLYRYLTGVPPFKADSTMELILAKENSKYTPAARINKAVPEKLDLIIDKMMAKDPKHRYQTCDELLAELIPLGLENPSLSFIDSNEKYVLGAAASGVSSAVITPPQPRNVQPEVKAPRSSREEAVEQKRAEASSKRDVWLVRYKDRTGKLQVQKMAADQIHRGLATQLLDETAQLSRAKNVPFAPIGSVKEFRDQVGELLLKKKDRSKKQEIKSIYEKIDRQHKRRKWWRVLENIKEGTFGWISLVVWLALVGGIGYGLYLGVPMAWQLIADNFGLTQ
ncbi:serine/threonine-protein kinase [Rubinisphaera margarita]|uniref:serine/threonine-protein kinase n=1 Tax=Rubinisphaera margarita TaxID=2909586 RepID=UPI001EE7C247|nr:serine/threonine-protein kinase [Rubinisphaera margarita]MCG6154321.1 serine/threonine protein kinase [Rubinisphaera margarita]